MLLKVIYRAEILQKILLHPCLSNWGKFGVSANGLSQEHVHNLLELSSSRCSFYSKTNPNELWEEYKMLTISLFRKRRTQRWCLDGVASGRSHG